MKYTNKYKNNSLAKYIDLHENALELLAEMEIVLSYLAYQVIELHELPSTATKIIGGSCHLKIVETCENRD